MREEMRKRRERGGGSEEVGDKTQKTYRKSTTGGSNKKISSKQIVMKLRAILKLGGVVNEMSVFENVRSDLKRGKRN